MALEARVIQPSMARFIGTKMSTWVVASFPAEKKLSREAVLVVVVVNGVPVWQSSLILDRILIS